MSKKIVLVRGGSKNPYKMPESGDILDSSCTVIDESGKQIYYSDHWRTIPSINLIEFGNVNELERHGVLCPGEYCGIWTFTNNLGNHFFMFDKAKKDNVKTIADVTYEMEIFKSEKPNPSMGGQNQISQTCLHSSTMKDSGSEGCLVGLYSEFHKAKKNPEFSNPAFDELFVMNEIVDIVLEEAPGYVKSW